MAEHEKNGLTDDWYTPPEIFDKLACQFDLDPCAGGGDFVPADSKIYHNGLDERWHGNVWLNPPFGGRNEIRPWLEKFIIHGNGIALVPNRTATDWFQEWANSCEVLLFLQGKLKFIRPDGSVGKSPGYGNVLGSIGSCNYFLINADLPGILVKPWTP